MSRKWLDNLQYFATEEKTELEQWCTYIGYHKYKAIYNLLSNISSETITFKTLKAVAKYEFNLSDFLHSVIKFVELRFRAFLLNKYDFEITKHNYITEISAIIGENERSLDSKTHYECSLSNETTFREFIEKSGMDTLFKVVKILSDDELKKLNLNKKDLDEVLKDIKKLRNDVAHSQLLLIENKDELKNRIITLLRCLPDNDLKKKRIDKLNEINKKFENELNNKDSKINEIKFVLTNKDKI